MSNFQYVFGNPIAGKKTAKKKVAKSKNKHKLDNKRKIPMAKQKRKIKIVSMKRKSSKKKNPAYLGSKNGNAKKVSVVFPSASEMKARQERMMKQRGFAKASGSKGAKKIAKKRLAHLKKGSKQRKLAEKQAAQMKKQGLDVTKLEGTQAEVAAKLKRIQMAKKKVSKKKKRSSKKTSGKKKRSAAQKRAFAKMIAALKKKKKGSKKKSKKVLKKKSKKVSKKKTKKVSKKKSKKVSKKKTSRKSRKSTSKKKTSHKKRRVSRKKRSAKKRGNKLNRQIKKLVKRLPNPIGGMMSKFSEVTGHTIKEAGGLAVGGLAYGAVNSLMTKIPVISKVQEQLVKIPVIGTSLPTLVMGAALNMLASKIKNKQARDAMEVLGSGLVGASIVGMGVNASQFIPGLKSAPLSGINYTMNGVQYSPNMNGVDFTMNGQLGQQADFGAIGDADFGVIPQGMGYGIQDDDNEEDQGEDFDGIPSGMSGEGQMG